MKWKSGWNNRVLIVDDMDDIHEDFVNMLQPHMSNATTDDLARAFASEVEDNNFLPEFELLHAWSGKDANKMVQKSLEENNPIAIAYIDISMDPGWNGIETMQEIRKIDRNIEIVIMTAHTKQRLSDIIDGIESLPKVLYLEKPVRKNEIHAMTISLIEKWNIGRDLAKTHRELAAVLDSTRDAIAMFDTSKNLLFANLWYAKMFGSTVEELKQMSPEELREEIGRYFENPNQFDEAEEIFYANLNGVDEEPIGKPVEMRMPERKVIYQSLATVRDIEENIIGHLAIYRDAAKEVEMAQIAQMKLKLLSLSNELIDEYSFDNIIGKSKKMQDMYALMRQAIESDITVLIRGDSGTGKELVAKSIHFNSQRSNGPFIAVNCAAIPETLIESELFGHERGAFTGAAARRIGRFEQANGGTILLDEIGEMNPSLQARLLRVLQEREIQRVGGTTIIPIDVRVVAATNKDLEAAMKAGEFREDLFYRIAAFPVTIAPLRERREDIPLLAEHFLGHAGKRSGKSIAVISKEALQLLMNYDWPGNVRELENVIERAVLLEKSGVLQAESLPLEIQSARKQFQVLSTSGKEAEVTEILPLEEMEKQAITRALKVTGNNIRQTAKVLGINRATVYRKMQKFDMPIRE